MADSDKDPFRAPLRGGYRYPLYRRNDRELPPEWTGWVYVWDIDNTYLITRYRTLRDLLRIRFEAAVDKRPVPGAVPLLQGLRRGRAANEERPSIHFVSASPHTMRKVLEERMLIDGVVHDGIAFRDWSHVRHLRDVFGYKVAALLLLRLESARATREVFFGDDGEHDPWVYSLYAQICAGKLRGEDLRRVLRDQGVKRSAAKYITALAQEVEPHDPVERIFIRRLRRRSAAKATGEAPQATDASDRLASPDQQLAAAQAEVDVADLEPSDDAHAARRPCELDPRLVEIDDYSQAAALLFAIDRIGEDDLHAVLADVRAAGRERPDRPGRGEAPLAALQHAVAAGTIPAEALERTSQALARAAAPPQDAP